MKYSRAVAVNICYIPTLKEKVAWTETSLSCVLINPLSCSYLFYCDGFHNVPRIFHFCFFRVIKENR